MNTLEMRIRRLEEAIELMEKRLLKVEEIIVELYKKGKTRELL